MLTSDVQKQLHTTYSLAPKQIDYFRQNGFVKLRDVLAPEVLHPYERAISESVDALNPLKGVPLDERDTCAWQNRPMNTSVSIGRGFVPVREWGRSSNHR